MAVLLVADRSRIECGQRSPGAEPPVCVVGAAFLEYVPRCEATENRVEREGSLGVQPRVSRDLFGGAGLARGCL